MKQFFLSMTRVITSKLSALTAKAKLLFKKSTWQKKATTKARSVLQGAMDVKPRNKKDYVTVFAWMVSKRLMIAIITFIGVLSCYYLIFVNPPGTIGGDGIRTYNYNSVPLRFTKGNVRIRAKSGYIAYEGGVAKGFAEGQGELFSPEGAVVYEGDFERSRYNGTGTLYYPGGAVKYNGAFVNNRYEGEGVLYRDNGSREYEGSFSRGLKEGEGTLYDSGNNQIFTGNFSLDELLYSDLLGKTTEELNEVYTGERTIYTDAKGGFTVSLPDIQAVYAGNQEGTALDSSMSVEGIYVLKSEIQLEQGVCKNISELQKSLGIPVYEGNSALTFAEAVALNCQQQESSLPRPEIKTVQLYSDVISVEDYDPEYLVYLYTYRKDGLKYTFFCKDKNGAFAMYLIEKE